MDKKFVDYTYDDADYTVFLNTEDKMFAVCKCGHYEMIEDSVLIKDCKLIREICRKNKLWERYQKRF